MKRRYYISGPWDESEGEFLYWNGPSLRWGAFADATPYLRMDLTHTLPEGVTGFMEYVDDNPPNWYRKEIFKIG